MRAVAYGEILALLQQANKPQNKKITNFKLICLHLQNKIILKKMFISTTSHISIPNEYFAIRSGQEMDLAPVIAMNFMCYKFFLY